MRNQVKLLISVVIFVILMIYVHVMDKKEFRFSGISTTVIPEDPKKDFKKYVAFHFAPACRLGNNLFEFSSLIGIAKTLKRIPVVHLEKGMEKMMRRINETIPGILDQILVINGTVPSTYKNVFFNPRCCVFEDPRVLQAIDSQYLYVDGNYYQSYKYFPGLRKSLISWMKISTNFQNLPESNAKNFITCAHIRRGDFTANDFAATDPNFLKGALNFIRKTKKIGGKSLKIVLFGDDLDFMKAVFEDTVLSSDENFPPNSTHFVSRMSPSMDLIYSKNHCDVVLISAPHSTFGWWMGFLSKGNTVYYQDIRVTNDALYKRGNLNPPDYYLRGWTALGMSTDNVTVVESP